MTKKKLLGATLATIAAGLLMAVLKVPVVGSLPRGFTAPVLAAELAWEDEVDGVFGITARKKPGQAQAWADFDDALRRNTYADFLFLTCYGTMFALAGRRLRGWGGRLAPVLAVAAAGFDVLENLGILRQIGDGSRPAWHTYAPSLAKWACLAALWLLLWQWFAPRGLRPGWELARLAVGLCFASAGALTAAGTVSGMAWNTHAKQHRGLVAA